MKMPKEMKEKWLAALRSGEYHQGYLALQDHAGGYCCLGVLQVVCDGKVERSHGGNGPVVSYPTEKWCLSHKVDFTPADMRTLGMMNDGKPDPFSTERLDTKSFLEIADYINDNIEGI